MIKQKLLIELDKLPIRFDEIWEKIPMIYEKLQNLI